MGNVREDRGRLLVGGPFCGTLRRAGVTIDARGMTMKTLVIGLGNPILTDDGVGVHIARRVSALLDPDSGVDVIEASVGGLQLMEAMIGYERVVIIDAIMTPGGIPGAVYELGLDRLPGTLNTSSAHDTNLPTALAVGRRLGAPLPADENVHIIAVEAVDVLTFGENCTPPVAAAIPKATKLALSWLSSHSPVGLP